MFYFLTSFQVCAHSVIGHQLYLLFCVLFDLHFKENFLIVKLHAQSYVGTAETKYVTWDMQGIISERGLEVRPYTTMHSNASTENPSWGSLK